MPASLRKKGGATALVKRWLRSFREFGILTTIAIKFQGQHPFMMRWCRHRLRLYLSKHYSDIASAPVAEADIRPLEGDFPLWVMWWQGEDGMPPIVRTCFETLKANAGGHPIHLVTRENYLSYIELPPYIMEKAESGLITLTHLSDIIRMCLLEKHGGLWLDATILLGHPLSLPLGCKLYTLRTDDHFNGRYISACRWTGYLLGTSAGAPIPKRAKEIFIRYWEKHTLLIDYVLIDCILDLLYSSSPRIKELFDSVPKEETGPYAIEKLRATAYDASLAPAILSGCPFHKLSYKMKVPACTAEGKPTWFGYLAAQQKAIPLPPAPAEDCQGSAL